jgi:hypothetical protein
MKRDQKIRERLSKDLQSQEKDIEEQERMIKAGGMGGPGGNTSNEL